MYVRGAVLVACLLASCAQPSSRVHVENASAGPIRFEIRWPDQRRDGSTLPLYMIAYGVVECLLDGSTYLDRVWGYARSPSDPSARLTLEIPKAGSWVCTAYVVTEDDLNSELGVASLRQPRHASLTLL